MIAKYKTSQFNFYVNDESGNMYIYNFLTGPNNVAKVNKADVQVFKEFVFDKECVEVEESSELNGIIKQLLELGILVQEDVDEYAYYEEKHYSGSFDSNLHLTILPTGHCMFRCPYCYEAGQEFFRNRMTQEKQKTLIKYVQKAVINHTSIKIGWYGGEPLLELETIKKLSDSFIKICKARHIPYVAEMTTNAFLLNPETFDQLYKLRVYTYMITLDGFKEQHDKIRCTSDGKGSFDTILNNLLYIRDNPSYKFANIIIRINVSKDVYEILDEMVDFVASTFADDHRFRVTFAAVVQYSDKSRYEKYVDPFEMHKRLFENETYMKILLNKRDKSLQLVPEEKCLASRKNAYVIMPDLSVRKCYSFLEQENNKLGVINEQGNMIIDEVKHRRWYMANRYVQRVPEKCQRCFYLPCCRLTSSGCPNRYTNKQDWQTCVVENVGSTDSISNNIINMINDQLCNIRTLDHIELSKKE